MWRTNHWKSPACRDAPWSIRHPCIAQKIPRLYASPLGNFRQSFTNIRTCGRTSADSATSSLIPPALHVVTHGPRISDAMVARRARAGDVRHERAPPIAKPRRGVARWGKKSNIKSFSSESLPYSKAHARAGAMHRQRISPPPFTGSTCCLNSSLSYFSYHSHLFWLKIYYFANNIWWFAILLLPL